MEEVEAIKEAQMVAREVFEVPKEKHPREAKQAQGKASACFKGPRWQFQAIWAHGGAHGALAGACSRAGVNCMLLSGSARLSGRICLDLCVVRGGIGWDPHPRTHGGLDPNVLDKLLL